MGKEKKMTKKEWENQSVIDNIDNQIQRAEDRIKQLKQRKKELQKK